MPTCERRSVPCRRPTGRNSSHSWAKHLALSPCWRLMPSGGGPLRKASAWRWAVRGPSAPAHPATVAGRAHGLEGVTSSLGSGPCVDGPGLRAMHDAALVADIRADDVGGQYLVDPVRKRVLTGDLDARARLHRRKCRLGCPRPGRLAGQSAVIRAAGERWWCFRHIRAAGHRRQSTIAHTSPPRGPPWL
jgi:hypothetical protein